MMVQGAFKVEPWTLRETYLDLKLLAQSESVFALANGYVGWRGNLEEGEPHGLPGSYLNGVYESRPLPYAEIAYGLPETGQSVINVTNGKLLRLFVDDEPFDVRSRRLHVEVTHADATYSFADGEPLEVLHYDEKVQLSAGKPEARPIQPVTARPRPSQPPGREPVRRQTSS
jgi:trehalose/maltose hydrolase-like predicted phosphorylase